MCPDSRRRRLLERIDSLREKLYAGMARNGLSREDSDTIYRQIQAFANFGFAESHSLSFALLVYASSWVKLRYPAAFLAGLLRAQNDDLVTRLVADKQRLVGEMNGMNDIIDRLKRELELRAEEAPPPPTGGRRLLDFDTFRQQA